ncbi:MAG: LysR family transcriptional regulator [Oligoflexus sp.]|nr:LysR family transcriptional regulator [Oligoflexus sp.]
MPARPWVNYHHLLYFKTIAIQGGIANAAKKLRLGQPTLSTQMKQFEETLGHELFDRSKRHLQLTEAGLLVLGYASEIFKLGDEMVDALNDQHVSNKVQVQIGAADTVAKHLTLKVFHKAQEAFDCIVSISEGHGDELLRELRAHRLDLVIANYPPPVGEAMGFYAKSIARMPVVVCGAAKFASLKRSFPESLEGQPFVFPSLQSKVRHDVEHYLKLRDIHVVMKAEVQDSSLLKLMGSHGDGLIPISLPAAEELIAKKELLLIGTLQDVYDEFWLIAAQRRIQNPVAAKIMKEFKI